MVAATGEATAPPVYPLRNATLGRRIETSTTTLGSSAGAPQMKEAM
jgi:hypothetical protein